MSNTSMNIRMDSEIKRQAQELFAQFGLDMTTAVNMFLRQSIRQRGIPFAIQLDPFYNEINQKRLLIAAERMEQTGETMKKYVRPAFQFGCLKGVLNIDDDFSDVLADFKEYM